jgi:predicted kinase
MMQFLLLKGCPGSGKSTWAKEKVAEDPDKWLRFNNDDMRSMMNNSVFSPSYEKIVEKTRTFLIREALASGRSILLDNVNAHDKHWTESIKLAKAANRDITVSEIPFYCPLQELIDRDSKRIGNAQVGEKVIRKFWNDLGREAFADYKGREEVFYKNGNSKDAPWEPMKQNDSLPRAVIFDNDGTICRIHPGRSPYDASSSDLDIPQDHTIEALRLYHKAGYKILFVSGREAKYREPTERFYEKHFPEVKYELFTRQTGDLRRDVIIKEEIFNAHIKDKYFVSAWFDDRLQVSRWVHEIGLPLFRVGNPEATF